MDGLGEVCPEAMAEIYFDPDITDLCKVGD
jgi:hypothetical protein